MKNYFLVSLGCSKNLVDAEGMLGILSDNGYILVDDESIADIIIINTCGFIESAKKESIDTIIKYGKYKSEGVCKLLIVTGCLAERYKQQILDEMPEVDAVLGVANYCDIVKIINNFEGRILLCDDKNKSPLEGDKRVISTPFYTAYLKIAEGCNNCCTYCAIPQIRGKYRSRKIENIVSEAQTLVDNGVRELIVIAQDTTRYGTDIYNEPMLYKLLEELCKIDDLKWIRVHYTYPELIDKKLIEVIKNNEKIVKYLDIPVQHSEDDILKAMNRRSTRAQLMNLIDDLRKNIPQLVIRTSIIVGFPGETSRNFKNLCEFVRFAKFDKMGVFEYSKEEGTKASTYKRQVPSFIKKKRYKKLMEIQKEISESINREKIGKTIEVLVEGRDIKNDLYIGRSYGDSVEIDGVVYFEADKLYDSGEFANVKVTDCDSYNLYGTANL